ncbi:hypothetical protein MTsPCn9_28300 [Croceitalea sp. MTPC9]|uniref:DUF4369 domain-containing protein n=1 Tax=unclassified Croceitalea TaxID=2632280 RepID=UPI002B39BAD7|nr:hypothetical protein MTsPCn6_29790 [Croceitalea sp. MTPC6]GMN17890.1 hypothetical protein MTsPCn9_28300 [Croceitalea sp. MTPC9]
MKNTILIFLITTILFSCDRKTENTMTVSGSIDGLKKGTLFFQKAKDSSLINIDSASIRGNGSFSFSYEIDSPELFYLHLDKADNNDLNDRITFFGEPGEIIINTSWNTFDTNSEIYGSKSHEKYAEFQAMLSKFNTREFELTKMILSEPEDSNMITEQKLDSIKLLIDKNILRRYQYILNFGLTNPKSYVTPYVTLIEAPDANPKYLDSINKALSEEVANSKYGKALKAYLDKLE